MNSEDVYAVSSLLEERICIHWPAAMFRWFGFRHGRDASHHHLDLVCDSRTARDSMSEFVGTWSCFRSRADDDSSSSVELSGGDEAVPCAVKEKTAMRDVEGTGGRGPAAADGRLSASKFNPVAPQHDSQTRAATMSILPRYRYTAGHQRSDSPGSNR